jgi:hypothetical protein
VFPVSTTAGKRGASAGNTVTSWGVKLTQTIGSKAKALTTRPRTVRGLFRPSIVAGVPRAAQGIFDAGGGGAAL